MNTIVSPAKRNTKQKESIFRAVTSVYTHPTAEEIYNMVVVDCPHVSLTTVYRNLNMLVEEGKLRRIAIPNDSDRFDATLTPHYHVKCDKCGAFVDVDDYDADINGECERLTGYKVNYHDIIFHGECGECR